MSLPVRSINHYSPIEVTREGCPSKMTPTYQVVFKKKKEKIIHEVSTMRLAHQTNGKTKNSLSLGPIHHQLELDSFAISKSGASNILLSTLSFDCLISDHSGNKYWDYVVFDLRIPGINLKKDALFLYDTVEAAYGSKANLYAALGHFYQLGRSEVNACDHKHGHCPSYDPSSSKHDQYIRHTEQYLVAYLALPKAAAMLSNRLRTEIRGKYANAASVTIFNMGLHMHSTKTCCAPCEYCLIGLMNDRKGIKLKNLQLGFLLNFQSVCSLSDDERLAFILYKKTPFRLLVTVSVSEPDAHHQKQPTYTKMEIKPNCSIPSYDIFVKKIMASQSIFTVMLGSKFDRLALRSLSNLTDKTVVISGSKATPGSEGTINEVKTAREDEMKQLESMMSFLKI
jgi:hypothetical protein